MLSLFIFFFFAGPSPNAWITAAMVSKWHRNFPTLSICIMWVFYFRCEYVYISPHSMEYSKCHSCIWFVKFALVIRNTKRCCRKHQTCKSLGHTSMWLRRPSKCWCRWTKTVSESILRIMIAVWTTRCQMRITKRTTMIRTKKMALRTTMMVTMTHLMSINLSGHVRNRSFHDHLTSEFLGWVFILIGRETGNGDETDPFAWRKVCAIF